QGRAEVRWQALPEMAADEQGLVHGGFVFGLADYAGMLAVNHPNVVIGAAELRFHRPVVVGDELVARAHHSEDRGAKKLVEVEVCRGEQVVLSGVLTCFVPQHHVLARGAS
ncbi:MAG TPA: PaaI family thioesterase, partial [Nannocystis exedens]|nr:PaaI family thioesterase [Nannocystis exedens]